MSKSDRRAQVGKSLAAQVQRLRGWVGSDPTRTPELADALVVLTEHRLLGHDFAAAAADAQASIKLAAQLLTAAGPIGPYTSTQDAGRYLDAVVQFAVLQATAGLVAEAATTVASADSLRGELASLPLTTTVRATTPVWALTCQARAALAADEPAQANALADAAWQRLGAGDQRGDGDATTATAGYLESDTERLVADARWAAGSGDAAVAHLLAARDAYDAEVAGRLSAPARLDAATLERLASPLFGTYRDLADRLIGIGEINYGLVVRRELLELLRGLMSHRAEGPAELAAAMADLERDLRSHGHRAEASLLATELAAIPAAVRESGAALISGSAIGSRIARWGALESFAAWAPAEAATAASEVREERFLRQMRQTLADLSSAAQTAESTREITATAAAAEQAAAQAAAAGAAAEKAAAEAAEAARQAQLQAAAERAAEAETAAAAAAERAEVKRRRATRMEEHRIEQERREQEKQAAEQAAWEELEATRRAADPAAQEAWELAQLAAEIAALEAAEQEPETSAADQLPEVSADHRDQPSTPSTPSTDSSEPELTPVSTSSEPIESKPAEMEPTDTEPADTEPADTEPAETEPAETEPASTEPTDSVQPEESDHSTAPTAEPETAGSTTLEAPEPQVETPRWRRLRRLLGGR